MNSSVYNLSLNTLYQKKKITDGSKTEEGVAAAAVPTHTHTKKNNFYMSASRRQFNILFS